MYSDRIYLKTNKVFFLCVCVQWHNFLKGKRLTKVIVNYERHIFNDRFLQSKEIFVSPYNDMIYKDLKGKCFAYALTTIRGIKKAYLNDTSF